MQRLLTGLKLQITLTLARLVKKIQFILLELLEVNVLTVSHKIVTLKKKNKVKLDSWLAEILHLKVPGKLFLNL